MNFKRVLSDRLNDEELNFRLSIGMNFVLISTGFTLSVLLFTYLFMRMNLIYFVAHGYPGASDFQDAFFDFVYLSLIDEIPVFCGVMLFIFGLGFYLSGIMLRPFKEISRYCEERMNNKTSYYSPEYFSDLKLLTSFSVFFFSRIDEAQQRGKLEKTEIPIDYMKIHKPVFEKNFFFNYLLIIAIFGLLASVGIFIINNQIREQIYILAQKFLNGQLNSAKGVHYFIEEQFFVADIAVYFFIVLHMLMYCIFGIYLYGKVSGPSFAIFATMRSFLKGNFHNRIHLIGHYYLRNDCRKINKFLDYLQKRLTE